MKTDFATQKEEVEESLKLSDQAIAVLMATLQKCLIEQSDIVILLKDWELKNTDSGLIVTNPPTKIEITELD